MNREQTLIWEYLISNAQGIRNFVHVSKIADDLRIPPKGTNNDDVRRWIKDMVSIYKLPIGTCKNGIYVIMNEDECEKAAKFLERNNRAEAVRRNGFYKPE